MKNAKHICLIVSITVITHCAFTQTNPHEPWEHHGESYYYADGEENPAAITDGNPSASTGQTNRQVVTDNALPDAFEAVDAFPEMSDEPSSAAATTAPGQESSEIGLFIGQGRYTAGNTDGDVSSVSIPYSYKSNERLTLRVSLPIYYTQVKDANFSDFPPTDLGVWGGGILLSGSYGVATPQDNKSYRWKVTPTVGFTWVDAAQIDVGSWSLSAAISSNFLYKLREGVILNIGNSLAVYHSQKLRGSYASLNRGEQAMLVNGVQLIFPRGRWVFNLFVMDNRYLKDAAIDGYQTYGIGGGYRVGKKTSIRLSYFTDRGDDYESHSFGISSAWKF